MRALLFAVLVCLVSSLGLAAGQESVPPAAKPAPAGGTVSGFVRYDGDIPRSWLADATPPVLRALPKDAQPDPALMKPPKLVSITKDRGVQGAVVVLESDAAAEALKAMPPVKAEVDQVGSVFVPPVTVIPRGGTVVFKNSDGINHNVHVVSAKQEKNVFMNAGENKEAQFRLPDNAQIVCDLHAWMRASLVVVQTPYYGVTDDAGHFEIKNIPPGKYTMKVLHNRLKPEGADQPVEIAAGSELTVEPKLSLGGR